MGKSGRRSVHDDPPSLPSSSPFIYYHSSTTRPDTYQLWSPNDFIAAREASTFGEPLSQIKNAQNKTSNTIASPDSVSSPKPSEISSNAVPTQKPITTTYKSYTSTYKSTPSTKTTTLGYNNYTELDRQRLRDEFFATYDVMTGIRIAATLGGFFFLMVFLIVYKSRSHSNRALRDPKIQARAAATVQEEEDRELQEAYEKTAFSLYQDELDIPPIDFDLNRDRLISLGNVSCPPYLLNPNLRFSSVGGYSSLLEPPRRYSDISGRQGRQSNSDSSRILSAYHLNDNYSNQNENFFNESDGEEGDDEFDQRFTTTAEIAYPHGLLVPRGADSRRSSGITCCSTESSFLERRCSAITLGLSSYSRGSSRRQSRDVWELEAGGFPGIHIIEATPKSSPCPSERQAIFSGNGSLKDHIKMRLKRNRHDDNSIDSISEYPDENSHQCSDNTDQMSETVVVDSKSNTPQNKMLVSSDVNSMNQQQVIRRAPLASLSSFKTSSIECQNSEDADGSVFEGSCNDTDEDVDIELQTDSDEISQSPPNTDQHVPNGKVKKKCDSRTNVVGIDRKEVETNLNAKISFTETIERQNDKTVSSSPSDKKSTSSDCVTINLVNYKHDGNHGEIFSSKPTAPSSVILEMPMLVKQNETSQSDIATIDPDPSASSSRRWSKETLF